MHVEINYAGYKGGQVVESGQYGVMDAHPNVASEAFEKIFSALLLEFASLLLGELGMPSLAATAQAAAIEQAKGAASAVLSGHDYARDNGPYFHPFPYYHNGHFDRLEVQFLACSEDPLKLESCKSIHVPREATRLYEKSYPAEGMNWYAVAYSVEPDKLWPGWYWFIFGAQDDGSSIDVALVDKWILDVGTPPMGWTEVPGSGKTEVAVAGVTFNDRLYLFGVGMENFGHYINEMKGSLKWSGWTPLPIGGTTKLPQAAVVFNGNLYLFAVGIEDLQIYFSKMDIESDWSAWQPVDGGGSTNAAVSAVAFNGMLYLFSKGIDDGRVYVNTMDNASNWSHARLISESCATEVSPVASLDASSSSRLWLFVVDAGTGGYEVLVTEDGKTWTKSSTPPGGLTNAAPCCCVGQAAPLPGGGYALPPLLLFGKGFEDQQIWVTQSNLDGSWQPWTPIACETDVSPAAVNFKGKVFLFGKGIGDRHVYCQINPQGT